MHSNYVASIAIGSCSSCSWRLPAQRSTSIYVDIVPLLQYARSTTQYIHNHIVNVKFRLIIRAGAWIVSVLQIILDLHIHGLHAAYLATL